MTNVLYSDRAYVDALYDSMERVYFNDIQYPAPNPVHYSFTVRADGLSLHKWLKYRISEVIAKSIRYEINEDYY